MKKIVLKIGIIMMTFIFFSIPIQATQTNTVTNRTSSNETTKQVTQEETPTEISKNETMYVQERCNIRESYSVNSDRVGGLDVGTEVTVIAEYSNGWYKIKYDGGEAYIKAGILRSTKPETEEPEENSEEQPEEQTQPDANMSTNTTPENNTNVDTEYEKLLDEIGVLPEVGFNVADILYGGSIILAIVILIGMKDKKEKHI